MAENVAAIRFAPYGPLVFCHTAEPGLARGTRVRVELAAEVREGIVAIAPQQIISAPALTDAPRVIAVIPAEEQAPAMNDHPGTTGSRCTASSAPVAGKDAGDPRGGDAAAVPPGVVFLPAGDGAVGPADLADALRLAALPVPEPPAERR